MSRRNLIEKKGNETMNFTLVPKELYNYVSQELKLQRCLNLFLNERSCDWYDYIGDAVFKFYESLNKNHLPFEYFTDKATFSHWTIYISSTMDADVLIKMFGEPIYHNHFGEGFHDGEGIEESYASYMLKNDKGHIFHLGYDHRGVAIEFPNDIQAKVAADEIFIPLLKEYVRVTLSK